MQLARACPCSTFAEWHIFYVCVPLCVCVCAYVYIYAKFSVLNLALVTMLLFNSHLLCNLFSYCAVTLLATVVVSVLCEPQNLLTHSQAKCDTEGVVEFY